MRIENKGFFRETFGRDTLIPFEKPIDYFNRTLSGRNAPRMDKKRAGKMPIFSLPSSSYLLLTTEPPPLKFEDDGCAMWEYRKPEICPVGIELVSRD